MNEVIRQDSRYPEWMKAWNAQQAEIDRQIIDFFQETKETTAESLVEIRHKLGAWWDRQHLDGKAREEYRLAREDAEHFDARIQDNVSRLEREGKLLRPAAEDKGMTQSGG